LYRCLMERCVVQEITSHTRYDATQTDVVSEFISDVEGFIPEGTHVVSTNNRPIRLRRIFAFLISSSLT